MSSYDVIASSRPQILDRAGAAAIDWDEDPAPTPPAAARPQHC